MEVYSGEIIISKSLDLYSRFNRTVYRNVAISIKYLYPLEIMLYDLSELFYLYFYDYESIKGDEYIGVLFLLDSLHHIFLMECLDDPDGATLDWKSKNHYQSVKIKYNQYLNSRIKEVNLN